MAETELVVVRTFLDRIEADLAVSALEAAGIDAMVRGDDAGGVQPGLWKGNDVIVRGEDADAAREVLDTAANVTPDAP